MNLRSVDLNLLVVLDALLRERHVTRAADQIGLSQPAMSNALGRLRHIFNDELLVRTARGMQPTPRAEALLERTHSVLRQVERVFEEDGAFQPATSRRKFTVRMSDLLSFLILPKLMARIQAAAPHVSLDVVHLPPVKTVDLLEKDELDIAVSTGLEHSHSVSAKVLFRDNMVCILQKNHPLAAKTLTLEKFLSARHLKISMSPTDVRFVDDVLVQGRLERDVGLNIPHWLVVPHVVASTDYLAVMPGCLAREIEGSDLVIRKLPFATEPFDWRVYWHRRHEDNQAIRWLREQIRAVCPLNTKR